MLWRYAGAVTALAVDRQTVDLGTNDGSVQQHRADNGRQLWRRDALCGAKNGVTYMTLLRSRVVVGCEGGRVLEVDRASGRITAHARPFDVDTIDGINAVGDCRYAVSGTAHGATTVGRFAILSCTDLHSVVASRPDASWLGAIGATGFLDDECCFGRINEYSPATIVRVDLRSGATSPGVDLAPERERYSRATSPGLATAILAGSHLYLGVRSALYRYADARKLPSRPARIEDTLFEPPTPFSGGYAGLTSDRLHGAPIRIVDLKTDPVRTVWSDPDGATGLLLYDRQHSAGVVGIRHPSQVGDAFVRLTDHAVIHTAYRCDSFASDGTMLVAVTTTQSMTSPKDVDIVEAYRWR